MAVNTKLSNISLKRNHYYHVIRVHDPVSDGLSEIPFRLFTTVSERTEPVS